MTKKDSSGKSQSPNDQRSDAKNPNNPAHKAAANNRSVQLKKPKGKNK